MKKLSILALLLFVSQAAFAQRTSTISAVATDDKTAEKIAGAVLILKSVTDTTIVKYGLANYEGKIVIPTVPYGNYTARLAMMGFEDNERPLTVNARTMNLGPLFMKESAIMIGEITVERQAIRTSQNGDTLNYNAEAFKVSPDAYADALLKKLPGITVNRDGTVTAQGETVTKILVDGKENFGTDVTATMSTIPADRIHTVQVYNELSDYSKNTGINDGKDYKVVNLKTNIKWGAMGRFSGGYNFEDKYALNADYAIFGGPHRLMLNGSSNNTGGLNFGGNGGFGSSISFGGSSRMSMARFGMGGMGGGGFGGGTNTKSTTHSIGMSYNYEKSKKFSAYLSYRYGYRDSESKNKTLREYLDPTLPFSTRNALSTSTNSNNQHTLGGRVEWRPDDKQVITFRPNLSFRNSPSTSFSQTTTNKDEDLFKDIITSRTNTSDQYNIAGEVQYFLRFKKPGRSFVIELSGSLNKNNGDSFTDETNKFPPPKPDSLGRSSSINHDEGYRLGTRVTYTEPISEFWRVVANYDLSNNYSKRNNISTKLNFETGQWEEWGQNSNVMTINNYTHRVGPGINYTKNRDVLNIRLDYQYTILNGKRKMPMPVFDSRATFQDLVYEAQFQKNFNPENSIEFRASSSTSNPSIEQLQDVDSGNSPYFRTGNSKLKPSNSYYHTFGYRRTSQTRGYTFSAFVNLSMTNNTIVDSTLIIKEGTWTSPHGTVLVVGDQYSKPINSGSSWGSGGTVSFGAPVNYIKSNFNVNLNYQYNETESFFNGEKTLIYNQNTGSTISLMTNFSEKFSASVDYSFSYNLSQFSDPKKKDDSSLNHNLGFNLEWITWKDLLIRTDLTYSVEKGISSNYTLENTMCNVTLGKKLLKNNRGELSVTVHDLFNQGRQTSRIHSTDYIEYRADNIIRRYFTVNFSYRLQNLNSPTGPGSGRRGEMRNEMRREHGSMRPPMRMGGERF